MCEVLVPLYGGGLEPCGGYLVEVINTACNPCSKCAWRATRRRRSASRTPPTDLANVPLRLSTKTFAGIFNRFPGAMIAAPSGHDPLRHLGS